MKEYRIIEDVTGLFFIEIKTIKRVGFLRKKIEVWKVANKYGNVADASFWGGPAKSYNSFREAKNQLERFKIGKVIR